MSFTLFSFVSTRRFTNSQLQIIRGDIMYKDPKFTDGKQSGLVADPFLTSVELDLVADDFIVMACDGLWDVMTHQVLLCLFNSFKFLALV